jgi:excisionase family DNA binding protein
MNDRNSRIDEVTPFDLISELSSRRKALTVMEVAAILDLSKQTLYDQIKRGKLKAFQCGTSVRLNPSDVVDWCRTMYTVQPRSVRRVA